MLMVTFTISIMDLKLRGFMVPFTNLFCIVFEGEKKGGFKNCNLSNMVTVDHVPRYF
jgi:hypothetical protein